MLKSLKTLFGASPSASSSSGASLAVRDGRRQPAGQPHARQSNGLDQFFASLRDQQGLRLLDFAGATQANISFITSLGHGLSSEDFVRALDQSFGLGGDFYENQADPRMMDQFLQENLNFPDEHFDGALVWDSLQFLTPHLLQITVDRLYETLRPNSHLLGFFNADEKAKSIPVYQYRITDSKTMMLEPRGFRPAGHFFNNRSLEKLFHRFQSVKFFLTRDNLREIIVRR